MNIKEIIKISHALLTIDEARLLFNLSKNSSLNGVIVEIGSYKGGSTIFLAKGSKTAKRNKVYAIDNHFDYDTLIHRVGKEIVPKSTLQLFKENIKITNIEDVVTPIIKTSEKAAAKWKKKISLLWIDGNHDYGYVKMDFLLWEKHLINGGIIAFHDTRKSIKKSPTTEEYVSKCAGPAKVVKKHIICSKRFKKIRQVDTITYAQKTEHAGTSELLINNLSVSFLKRYLFLKRFIGYKAKIKKIDQTIGNFGLLLRDKMPFLYALLKWKFNKKEKLIFIAKPYTLLSYQRLNKLYELASELEKNKVNGCFVECGVWNGGSAGIIASVAKNNKKRYIWLFDSWQGLPKPSKCDLTYKNESADQGDCLGYISKVRELLFKKLKLKPNKNHIVKGWFKDTIKNNKDNIGEIALLHLDCDWYDSVKLCLEELYGNVIKGGYIVIDDYGYWKGAKKAVNEFIKKKNLKIKLNKIDCTGVYFKKP